MDLLGTQKWIKRMSSLDGSLYDHRPTPLLIPSAWQQKTTGYQLRPIDSTDDNVVHDLLDTPEVFSSLCEGTTPPGVVASRWMTSGLADQARYGLGLWLLTKSAGTSPAGLVRLSSYKGGTMELTYLLHPSSRGLGLATMMAHTVLRLAFYGGKVDKVWAGADSPNLASIAVMQRLGMRFLRTERYPAGVGIEYQIRADDYDVGAHDFLAVTY